MFDYQSIDATISALHFKQIFFIGGSRNLVRHGCKSYLTGTRNIGCKGEGFSFNQFAPLLKQVVDNGRTLQF